MDSEFVAGGPHLKDARFTTNGGAPGLVFEIREGTNLTPTPLFGECQSQIPKLGAPCPDFQTWETTNPGRPSLFGPGAPEAALQIIIPAWRTLPIERNLDASRKPDHANRQKHRRSRPARALPCHKISEFRAVFL